MRLLADGRLAVSTDAGLRAIAAGRITELVRGDVDTPRGFPPTWAGERIGRAWVSESSGFAVAPGGEWILGGSGGLLLVTRPGGGSTRLAAAVLSSTQRAVWRRRVELQARAPDGAFASHRRSVLGRPRLPLGVARRALHAYLYPGGDAYSELSRCRRLGPRRIRCRQVAGGDGTVERDEMVTATLRRDGWIEARSVSGRARLEVPPAPSRRSRAPAPAPS
ncbi:MAG TPA: hypothetical protein VFN44_10515 [Solirubrobacteraceae bacterium]|nr:hypothetical protein [Solirubrobacteraceae bacterium]